MSMFDPSSWFASKPSTVTQTSTNTLGAPAQSLFDSAFPALKQFASAPLTPFGGSGVASLTPDQIAAQNSYKAAIPGVADSAGKAMTANNSLMDPNFMNAQPLADARAGVTDSVTNDFLRRVLPSLRTGSTQAGGMYSGGSTKSGIAEANATSQTGQSLADSISQMMLGAWTQGRNQMGSAVDRNPSVQQQQLAPGNIQGAVGAQNQAQAQAELDDQIKRFYTGQMLPAEQSSMIMSMLSGMPGNSTTSTATGNPQSAPWWQQLAGLGMGIGGAATGLGGLINWMNPKTPGTGGGGTV